MKERTNEERIEGTRIRAFRVANYRTVRIVRTAEACHACRSPRSRGFEADTGSETRKVVAASQEPA